MVWVDVVFGLDLVDLFDLDVRLVCDSWLIVDLIACCIVWFIVCWVVCDGCLVVGFVLVGGFRMVVFAADYGVLVVSGVV